MYRYQELAPYFYTFCFLLATGYFTRYFLKSVYPLVKVKRKEKENYFFKPCKYKAPFIEDYYLKTTLNNMPLIHVERGFYEIIDDNSIAALYYSEHAKFILSVVVDHKRIDFNYSLVLDDLWLKLQHYFFGNTMFNLIFNFCFFPADFSMSDAEVVSLIFFNCKVSSAI
ncbi:MAG: hypothetical protein C4308_04080 [Chitinophagaceae bacterium]